MSKNPTVEVPMSHDQKQAQRAADRMKILRRGGKPMSPEAMRELSLALNVSNLFNKIASSGGVGGPNTLNGQRIVELRPETGRSASMTLRYNF